MKTLHYIKKILRDIGILYALWITYILFSKGETDLALKFTLPALAFSVVTVFLSEITKQIQNYYKKKDKEEN